MADEGGDGGGVQQRGRVAQVRGVACGHLTQDSAHDLPTASLGQRGRVVNHVWGREGAYQLAYIPACTYVKPYNSNGESVQHMAEPIFTMQTARDTTSKSHVPRAHA